MRSFGSFYPTQPNLFEGRLIKTVAKLNDNAGEPWRSESSKPARTATTCLVLIHPVRRTGVRWQESLVIVHRGMFENVTAELVMSRIVISSHSDLPRALCAARCYERTLMLAISLSEQAGSDFDLSTCCLQSLPKMTQEKSLALSIIKSLRLCPFDALRRVS